MIKIYRLLLALSLIFSIILGRVGPTRDNSLAKTTVKGDEIFLDANRVECVFYNNGIWGYNTTIGNWGVEWPKGSGLSPIFAAGEMLGAKINGDVRVAGIQHDAHEFQPGIIKSDGSASNPAAPEYRWYSLEPNGIGDWGSWPSETQGAPLTEEGEPEMLGNQTIFSVWNDLAPHGYYGTKKLGAEIHQKAWAYNRADAIGDMIFVEWKLINKRSEVWEDAYFVIWQDPDVGDAGDDLVGCDSTLGLGYAYNGEATDQNYGSRPPATGMDFFQGPIIDSPGDTVVLPDGRVFPDKKQLRMTSFVYYNNDNSNQGNPENGQDVYNYMQGFWRDGSPIVNDGANGTGEGPKTKYMFSGDPESNSGWLDSNPADRRFMMTTGPFDMDPWEDTNGNGKADLGEPGVQVIVAGLMNAMGSDNLNSVTLLKSVDQIAQLAYDNDFELPSPPKAPRWRDLVNESGNPTVHTSERPNSVLIKWDQSSEYLDQEMTQPYHVEDIVANGLIGQMMVTEDGEYKEVTDGTFDFTGYTVYQYSNASGSDPVVYAEYGPETISAQQPYNGQRYIMIDKNKNPAVGPVGDKLVNGKEYYFGVQARSYCEFAKPQDFNSPVTIVSVTPQHIPGERYSEEYTFQDTVAAEYHQIDSDKASSAGNALAMVVDKTETTGHDYKITFNSDQTWNLIDVTEGDTVLSHQSNQRGDDNYDVVDGLLVKVQGPEPGIDLNRLGDFYRTNYGSDYLVYDQTYLQGWDFTPGRWITGADVSFGLTFWNGLANGYDFWGTSIESGAGYVDTELQWAGVETEDTTLTDSERAALSMEQNPDRWSVGISQDYMNNYAQSKAKIPFSAWDMENDKRLKIGVMEFGGNGRWDFGEYLFILNEEYDTSYTDYLNWTKDMTGWGNTAPVMYVLVPSQRGDHPYLEANFNMQIYRAFPNTTNDYFTFTAPAAPSDSLKFAKEDLDLIKAVPNPYYGYHSGEMSLFDRWIQFTNLPEECEIMIFDLAGNKVVELEKDDPNQTLIKWDMKNEYDLPVASGVYVYLVKAPGIGEKTGKLAIFAPDERLDTY
ncbi:MAG: hypothetical protein K9M80_07160 [Candidatus Marinimicrobia bacterium]|nr:hypothetical protein [Candidatus Neomarinimicrobiota bacterium]